MKINNIDIANFEARQKSVVIKPQEILNSSSWGKGSLVPTFLDSSVGFKSIEVILKVTGRTRDIIKGNISNLLSNCLKEITLNLDGYKNLFKCVLIENELIKKSNKNANDLRLVFHGFEYGTEIIETLNKITTKTINVKGNTITPCIVEITPTIDIIDLTLEGLDDDPITIKNLKANNTTIIDGISGLVTRNGLNVFADVDLWEFPKLTPGQTIVKISRNNCNVTIKYNPRFL